MGKRLQERARPDWLNALGDDAQGKPTQPPTLTHEQVITDFIYSQESLTRLVEGYYQVFLQRLAEPKGLSAWLTALQQGLPFATIGEQFLSSDEFYNAAAAHG